MGKRREAEPAPGTGEISVPFFSEIYFMIGKPAKTTKNHRLVPELMQHSENTTDIDPVDNIDKQKTPFF